MARKRIKDGESIIGELQKGEILQDKTGNKWKLGKAIGIGGFGEIYDISSCKSTVNVDQKSKYVAKIEKHSSGPLFVEINCYLRLGKLETIEKWKVQNNLTFLGMPHFVASGSHSSNNKYRFLVLPKYKKDLEAILRTKRIFNLKTVLVIASRIIDTLEYIHSHGYVHSDIKAPNIMLSQGNSRIQPKRQCRYAKKIDNRTPLKIHKKFRHHRFNLRPITKTNYYDDSPYLDEMLTVYEKYQTEANSATNTFEGDQIYLLDYGLATKYILTNGEHRKFAVDHRRAHAGTIQFCSRDAHKGVASRRSDLESLAYNMIYWLTGTLPWLGDVNDPELVEKKKNKVFTDVKLFLQICFEDVPQFLVEMFKYLSKLSFEEAPNYNFFRELFTKTIKNYGYKEDWKLDFDNLESWSRKEKTVKNNRKENKCVFKRPSMLLYSPLKPLSSNIILKRPKLRKKINDKLAQDSMMNWSKILVDPETIIKQATNRQKSPDDDRPLSMSKQELESMNPTAAMREVFGKLSEKLERSPYYGCRRDELPWIEGYTAEMMRVHRQAVERQELEMHLAVRQTMKKYKRKRLNASVSPSRSLLKKLRSVAKSEHCLRRTRTCRRA